MPKAKLLELEQLKTYAAQALAARAQSSSELRTRLRKKAARLEDVDEILAYLNEAGYIDDRRFAGAFADWRRDSQGMGKARASLTYSWNSVSTYVANPPYFEGITMVPPPVEDVIQVSFEQPPPPKPDPFLATKQWGLVRGGLGAA